MDQTGHKYVDGTVAWQPPVCSNDKTPSLQRCPDMGELAREVSLLGLCVVIVARDLFYFAIESMCRCDAAIVEMQDA